MYQVHLGTSPTVLAPPRTPLELVPTGTYKCTATAGTYLAVVKVTQYINYFAGCFSDFQASRVGLSMYFPSPTPHLWNSIF